MATQPNNRRDGNVLVTAAWIGATALILLTPLVAMQFSDEVQWTASDFAFAGAILIGCGLTYEVAARAGNLAYQVGVVVALGAGVLQLWVTGAVGIIGDEGNPGNLAFLAVVAVAIGAAVLARGRAAQMVGAMALTGAAQVLAPVVAYIGLADPRSAVLAPEVFAATAFLTAAWLGSAWLFRRAARDQKPSNAA